MTEEIELKLLSEIEALKQEIRLIKGENQDKKPVFQYSKIRDNDLESLLDIERSLDKSVFKQWFDYAIPVNETTKAFFIDLIQENEPLIDSYSEEDLKVNFLVPILSKVHFKSFENNIRDFYELPLRYETEHFIFTGTTDFVVSSGLIKSKTPYFLFRNLNVRKSSVIPDRNYWRN